MRITFHLTKGVRLDRLVRFDNGMTFYQSISKGWYDLHAMAERPDAKNEISEFAAAEALVNQYHESGAKIDWFEARDRLYEFDLRQIIWRSIAAA